MIKFTIPVVPRTKKNSQRILRNQKTGRPFVMQSTQYIEYEKAFLLSISARYRVKIDYPVNLCATFFMPSKRRVDLVNLLEALQDALVKANVLADDNSKIVKSVDGSRVLYDKEHPRTEVIISEANI
jgi:Holliday junction resolvase RusA-like endonuclease